jgi:bacterioferritin (cytochrome b1)
MDKLGERLAFERAGVRLYEAAIVKCEALQAASDEQLPLEGLRHICKEEAGHAELIVAAIQQLGGDPTAQTPSADLVGVEGMGLMQVLGDPRTTLAQSLHALLIAELADNAAWELLITMIQSAKQSELATRFERARADEAEHLARVKQWHAEAVMREASLKQAVKSH